MKLLVFKRDFLLYILSTETIIPASATGFLPLNYHQHHHHRHASWIMHTYLFIHSQL
jgi:hypothetical protein